MIARIKCGYYVPCVGDAKQNLVDAIHDIMFKTRKPQFIDVRDLPDGRYFIEYTREEVFAESLRTKGRLD